MNTKILNSTQKDVKTAVSILKSGGIVAIPTETIYGLAADAFNKEAVEKIFEVKNRPNTKALIVLISKLEDINTLGLELNEKALKLASVFWPGPLTLVLKKNKYDLKHLSLGQTLAVRFTSSKIATAIMKGSGMMLTAPSANISGEKVALNYKDVLKYFDGKINAIVSCEEKLEDTESTIVDVSSGEAIILREGKISKEQIEFVLEK